MNWIEQKEPSDRESLGSFAYCSLKQFSDGNRFINLQPNIESTKRYVPTIIQFGWF